MALQKTVVSRQTYLWIWELDEKEKKLVWNCQPISYENNVCQLKKVWAIVEGIAGNSGNQTEFQVKLNNAEKEKKSPWNKYPIVMLCGFKIWLNSEV